MCPVTYSEAMVLATGVAGSATAVHLPLDLDRSPAVLTAGLKNLGNTASSRCSMGWGTSRCTVGAPDRAAVAAIPPLQSQPLPLLPRPLQELRAQNLRLLLRDLIPLREHRFLWERSASGFWFVLNFRWSC